MSMWGRIGRSGRNLVATGAAEVVIRLLGLVYLVTLARHLEPDGFGVFNALLAYFALAVALGNLGLDHFALRHLAVDRRAHSFPTLLWLRIGAAGLTAGILLIAGSALATPSPGLFGILAVAVMPAGIGSAFTASFRAREEFGVPAAGATAGTVVMVGISLVGIAVDARLAFFLWALVASESVRATWLAVTAWRRSAWALLSFDVPFARHALRAALPYGLLAVLGAVYFRIDLIMLDAMLGGDAVGHYASAYRVLDTLVLVPGLVLSVLFPRFARLHVTRPAEARALYLSVARLLAWSGLGLSLAGILLAGPILRLLFSDAYADARPSLTWLMIALLFAFWHAPNATVLFAGDRLGRVVGLSFFTAGFNVVANAVVIPRYGAEGAAATTAASELLSWAIFTPIVLGRLGISLRAYGRAQSWPWWSRSELRLLLGVETPAHGDRPKRVHSALRYDLLARDAGGLGDSHRWLQAGVPRGATVLDCGCAGGFLASSLIESRGCTVDGAELDEEAAAAAAHACRHVYVGSLEDPAFVASLNAQYDCILFGDVLEHLRDPNHTLRMMRPKIANGGRILVSMPNTAYWRVRWELLRGRFEYRESGLLDRTHLRFYTYRGARALVEAAGYRIVRQEFTSPAYAVPIWGWLVGRCARAYPNLFAYQSLIEAEPE